MQRDPIHELFVKGLTSEEVYRLRNAFGELELLEILDHFEDHIAELLMRSIPEARALYGKLISIREELIN